MRWANTYIFFVLRPDRLGRIVEEVGADIGMLQARCGLPNLQRPLKKWLCLGILFLVRVHSGQIGTGSPPHQDVVVPERSP